MGNLLSRLRPTLAVQVTLAHTPQDDHFLLTIVSRDDESRPLQTMLAFDGAACDASDILATVDRFLDVWMRVDDRAAHTSASKCGRSHGAVLWR